MTDYYKQDLQTQIHGIWYDFTHFEHPGGPIPLTLASRRDATALFELHHPFTGKDKMQAILKKYKLSNEDVEERGIVLDEYEENSGEFEWDEEDPFRKDLVNEVRLYFEGLAKAKGITLLEATKATDNTVLLIIAVLILTLAMYPYYVMGYWWTLVFLPPFVWMLGARFMHDGSHFSMSTDWRINQILTHAAPWAASSSTWFVQHVIGHHAHTNIPERDPDLYHGVENWRYVPWVDWAKHYRNQHILFPLMWAGSTLTTSFLAEIFNDVHYNGVTYVGKRTSNHYRLYFWIRWIINIVIFGAPIYTCGWLKGGYFLVVSWIYLSALFMTFTQVSHLDEICGTSRHPNFWKHQLSVSSDYSGNSVFWNWVSIGLNCQAIHHLFPTINPCHFPALFPIIKGVAQRHGVVYNEKKNLWEALKSYWAVLRLYAEPNKPGVGKLNV